jgi:hypothetical protein
LPLSLTAVTVDGCGGDGVFAAPVNKNNKMMAVTSTATAQLMTMTAIAAVSPLSVKDATAANAIVLLLLLMVAGTMPSPPPSSITTAVEDAPHWCRWLHPTSASVNDDRHQQRPPSLPPPSTTNTAMARTAIAPATINHRCSQRQ